MKKLLFNCRWLPLVLGVTIFLAACTRSLVTLDFEDVVDQGWQGWTPVAGVSQTSVGFRFQAPPGGIALMQIEVSLEKETVHEMNIELSKEVEEPSHDLIIDLYRGAGYDSLEQQMTLPPSIMGDLDFPGNAKWEFNTGNCPPKVFLRVFTFSTNPIYLSRLELHKGD